MPGSFANLRHEAGWSLGESRPTSTNRATKPVSPDRLKNDLALSRAVEANLTNVVLEMCRAGIGGYGVFWGEIFPIGGIAISDADKRVVAALRNGFFNFGQLLCCLEMLLLESHELGVVGEETLLSIKQLVVHLRDHRGQLVGVAQTESSLAQVHSAVDGCDGTADQAEVHTGSPNVEKGCVRTPDSTLRGNCEGEGGHA